MHTFFDIIITILIFATFIPAIILLYSVKSRPTSFEAKYKKTTYLISTILLICTIIVVYGSFIEPYILTLNEVLVNTEKMPKTVKIAFLADMQVGQYRKFDYIQKITDRLAFYNPDIIILGGDFVENFASEPNEYLELAPLGTITKKYPTYAVLGNHEYGIGSGLSVTFDKYRTPNVADDVNKYLTSLGIRVLRNELIIVTSTPSPFYLFGVDEWMAHKQNLRPLKNDRTENLPTIVVVHNPYAAETISSYDNIDLILAGHTHGGQIRLPFIGPLGRVDDVTPIDWYQGLRQVGNSKLFVTSGVGETGARARLFNPPEIVILTIN
ncbi:MAG TPA: metallophosphoesterase [Candidatus Magasanikbacteria bacterium]|nr:metallophosphoesterase [Candidatus Magasanikbacteria bacterium]